MRKTEVMEIQKGVKPDNVVHFAGAFTVEKGEEIRQKLCFAMVDCPRLSIDLSAVTRIDLAGFQLICATHRKAQESGTSIRLLSPLPAHIASSAADTGFPENVFCNLKSTSKIPCMWHLSADTEQGQPRNSPR